MKMLTVTLFFFTALTMAQDRCERPIRTIDMASEVGPIKDQDGIGWCYAFSAADLLNQHLYRNVHTRHGTDEDYTVSPTSLAVLYNRYGRERAESFRITPVRGGRGGLPTQGTTGLLADGGRAGVLLDIAFEHPICLERQFRSTDLAHIPTATCDGPDGEGSNCGLINTLRAIYNPNRRAPATSRRVICEQLESAQSLFPGLSEEFILNALRTLRSDQILPALINRSCRFRRQISDPHPRIRAFEVENYTSTLNPRTGRYDLASHNRQLFTEMDQALRSGKVVSASIFPQFLQKANPVHATRPPTEATTTDPARRDRGWKEGSTHAVTVVGMRTNPKTCEVEYKIKNSWGRGCNMYRTDPVFDRNRCIREAENDVLREGFPARCNDPLLTGGLGLGLEFESSDTPEECRGAFKSADEIEAERQACRVRHSVHMINPRLSCEGDGYVFVPKSELAKHMFGVNFLGN